MAETPRRIPCVPLGTPPSPSGLWFIEGWRCYGFDGRLWVVSPDGRDMRTERPAIKPYDPDEELESWPKPQLYFVTMCGCQHAVIASSMREACMAIENANGWN